MVIQYAVQVNAVEHHRGSQTHRGQVRPEVPLEGPALDAEIRHRLLAVEAALIHGGTGKPGCVRSCQRCHCGEQNQSLKSVRFRFEVFIEDLFQAARVEQSAAVVAFEVLIGEQVELQTTFGTAVKAGVGLARFHGRDSVG